MRFAAFRHHGQPALGLRMDQGILNLTAQGLPGTLDELLRAGPQGLEDARRAAGKARDMIFDVATLVSVCSQPFALQAGDTCEIDIEGIGTLSNPIIDGVQ